MMEILTRYTGPFDAIAAEAAHSGNEHDVSVMLRLLEDVVWNAEAAIGYHHELAGEVAACGDCWEDERVGYWLPKLEQLPGAETLEEKIALCLAAHRALWYLQRVRRYGAEEFDLVKTPWALKF